MESKITSQLKMMSGPLTGVHMETLEFDGDFLDLASGFAHLPGTVVLLSGGELDCSRYHILGAMPWLSLSARFNQVQLRAGDRGVTLTADPFEVLEAAIDYWELPEGAWPNPMAAGLMGYLAYDLKDCLETLPRTSVDETRLPLMLLYAPSAVVVHDRLTRTTRLMVPERQGAAETTARVIKRFRQAAEGPGEGEGGYRVEARRMVSNFSRPEYHQAVQRIIQYIAAGDVYQVNMTQRFEAPFSGNGFALFRRLFALNPAPFFAYIQAEDHQVVSTSPERFMLQRGRRVETRPIKGTRPRCPKPEQDAAMRAELENSPKDDAELSMIVDLLRNDIGKVCQPVSVRVREHKRLEAYENVYHLVSIVEGELEEERSSVGLIRAAFPGGSITGCPKVRSMEIIDELETCRRHVYCGSIGYISFHRSMDLSIAIRTATLINDTLRFSVGGGIVYDSDPSSEYEETLHKSRTLMAACESSADTGESSPVVWLNGRLTDGDTACVKVTDQGLLYGFGFFETIRVDRGHAPLLADHLLRFNASWQALMPDDPPDLSWEEIIRQVIRANGLDKGCAAVKMLATRGSRGAAPWDHALLVTARPYTHRLSGRSAPAFSLGTYPHPRQSPLADHKTLNYLYYLRAGYWALKNGLDEALILNPDGSVSETNTANLLLISGKQVIRPASSAVLSGVMAAALCRKLDEWGYHVICRPVPPNELMSTGQVLAANALMGAVPVTALDGLERPVGGDLWRRLNDAVIPGWDEEVSKPFGISLNQI